MASFATARVIFTARVNYTFTTFSLSPRWKHCTILICPNVKFAFHNLRLEMKHEMDKLNSKFKELEKGIKEGKLNTTLETGAGKG